METEERKIAPDAEQVLKESYVEYILWQSEKTHPKTPYSIAVWCDCVSSADPDFFRWLFNDTSISDFGSNLTDEEMEIATNFFLKL